MMPMNELIVKGLKYEANQLLSRITTLIREAEYPEEYLDLPLGFAKVAFKRISCLQKKLDVIRKELVALDEGFDLSAREKKECAFNEYLSSISTMYYSNGGFGGGIYFSAYFECDFVRIEKEDLFDLDKEEYYIPKNIFLNRLRKLRLGGWRRNYSIEHYGMCIDDGDMWSLEVKFNDGRRSLAFDGHCAYPYNYHLLEKLFSALKVRHVTDKRK
jgi:hypothetical protein